MEAWETIARGIAAFRSLFLLPARRGGGGYVAEEFAQVGRIGVADPAGDLLAVLEDQEGGDRTDGEGQRHFLHIVDIDLTKGN